MNERNDNAFFLSIVIPAFNEQDVIEATLEALAGALDDTGWRYELRVVDDGSTDGTWALLERLKAARPALAPIKNGGPGGYGMAVRKGLETFEGDAVIVAMADGSDAPEDVVAYGQALADGYDAAFGTRFSGQTEVTGYPVFKRLLNRLGNAMIAFLVKTRYDDFTNGFKGYRRHVVEAMQPLVSADFNLTVEMSIKAVQNGARFKIIPNSWRDRDAGESKFNLLKLGPRYMAAILYCLTWRYLRAAGARPRPDVSAE